MSKIGKFDLILVAIIFYVLLEIDVVENVTKLSTQLVLPNEMKNSQKSEK